MARDYILRLIDHVALMLAEILAKRKRGERAEARTEIETQALQQTGLPLGLIRGAAPAMVAELLRNGGELRFIRGVVLAELLLQDAEICEESGDLEAALAGYMHAWHLLHDAAISFGPEERTHFRAKQDHARDRLCVVAAQLGVDAAALVPREYLPETHDGTAARA